VRRAAGWLAAGLALWLAGCGGDKETFEDLQTYTDNLYKNRRPVVEPLPVFRPHAGYAYSAADLPDPFAPSNLQPARAAGRSAGGGRAPNPNRRKEPLEAYPLDSLTMVGTLTKGKQTWAIIRAPDGTVHHAQVGNYVGENFGLITAISEARVSITELIPGPGGSWIERKASLTITD